MKKVILVTEDGVQITSPKTKYYGVMENDLSLSTHTAKYYNNVFDGELYFSTEDAAIDYIEANSLKILSETKKAQDNIRKLLNKNTIKGKKIILAITGSIAAYKMPSFVRLLRKEGAQVKVILTPAASDFVSPLVLSVLSGNAALQNVISDSTWNNHVDLALWADLMIIAPCSLNTIGKLTNGLCDNLLCAVYLSARCPIFIAPAMDEDMWKHPSTQRNIKLLESYNNHIIPVGSGELASGLVGPGRMAEPEEILFFIKK